MPLGGGVIQGVERDENGETGKARTEGIKNKVSSTHILFYYILIFVITALLSLFLRQSSSTFALVVVLPFRGFAFASARCFPLSHLQLFFMLFNCLNLTLQLLYYFNIFR